MSLERHESLRRNWTEIPYNKLAEKGLLPDGSDTNPISGDPFDPDSPENDKRRLERATNFLKHQKPLTPFQDTLRLRALESFKKPK